MTRTLFGLLAVLAGAAFGQTAFPEPAGSMPAGPKPAFEVADIHPSARVTNPYMRGGGVRGGRYEVKDASLLDLISTAYGVPYDRVQGGPPWLNSDRFDIIAKAPGDAAQATLNS